MSGPFLLCSAPARSAEVWTAWTSTVGSCQRGPGRNKTDLRVTTHLAFTLNLCQRWGRQAWGRAVETKRLAGAHRPHVGCWASSRAGPSRAVDAGPGLPVFSLCLQVSNLHICCHGLELRFTPGSACVVRHRPNLCSRRREGKSSSLCWLWVISLLAEEHTRFLEH